MEPSTQTLVAPAAPKLTLKITAGGTPVAGRFFQDIGRYNLSGTLSTKAANKLVTIWWYTNTSKKWVNIGSTLTKTGGSYSFSKPVTHYQTGLKFRTTLGSAPAAGVMSSDEVKINIINASLTMNTPVASIDSLKNPKISGSVYPARKGVKISLDVYRSGKYQSTKTTTTNSAGKFSTTFSYGKGSLATYKVRVSYRAANRPRTEATKSKSIKRTAVLAASIHRTTAAEVAKTYRAGCPVGPSKLSTINMNFYGFDKRMHRGQLIVRTTTVSKVTKAFGSALAHRYPIRKMNNPNLYGGSDPKMMAADNTSAFNCRKVTGNPYATSPHSYGTAIDVNTVENPYRDVNGRWWPSNKSPYIDRSPKKKGMLTVNSYLTKSLRGSGYFWGGLWSPDRDYQHFQD